MSTLQASTSVAILLSLRRPPLYRVIIVIFLNFSNHRSKSRVELMKHKNENRWRHLAWNQPPRQRAKRPHERVRGLDALRLSAKQPPAWWGSRQHGESWLTLTRINTCTSCSKSQPTPLPCRTRTSKRKLNTIPPYRFYCRRATPTTATTPFSYSQKTPEYSRNHYDTYRQRRD